MVIVTYPSYTFKEMFIINVIRYSDTKSVNEFIIDHEFERFLNSLASIDCVEYNKKSLYEQSCEYDTTFNLFFRVVPSIYDLSLIINDKKNIYKISDKEESIPYRKVIKKNWVAIEEASNICSTEIYPVDTLESDVLKLEVYVKFYNYS